MAPSRKHTLIFYEKSGGTVHGCLVRGLLQEHLLKQCSRVHQNGIFIQKIEKFSGEGAVRRGGRDPLSHLPLPRDLWLVNPCTFGTQCLPSPVPKS